MNAGIDTASRDNRRRTRPRGYAPYRPQAANRLLLEQIANVLDEYAEHLPLSVRQVYYRLVAQGHLDKTEAAYERLSEVLVRARRGRLVDFDDIRDDGVVTQQANYYTGVADFHDETAKRIRRYRRDRQEGQPVRIELWCEAAGMLPQLARVANEYSVPVFSAGGFASLTAVRHISTRAVEREVPTILLHVGDYDPSGQSTFVSMARDAATFVQADRDLGPAYQRIDAYRVALTANQVNAYQLPMAPAKKTDSRARSWTGGTCQLEALPPDVLAKVVESAIRDRLDLEIFEHQVALEDLDRAELLALPPGAPS